MSGADDSPPVFLNQQGLYPRARTPNDGVDPGSPGVTYDSDPAGLSQDRAVGEFGGSPALHWPSPTPNLSATHQHPGGDFSPAPQLSGGTPPQQTTPSPGPKRKRRTAPVSPKPDLGGGSSPAQELSGNMSQGWVSPPLNQLGVRPKAPAHTAEE